MKNPTLALTASLLLAPAARASDHTDGPTLIPSGGVLSDYYAFDISDDGSPNDLFVLVPSLLSGPIVLPGGIVAEVGLDLLGLATIGFLDGAGKADVIYPLPPLASLAGVNVRAQVFLAATGTTVIEEASEVVARNLRTLGEVIESPSYSLDLNLLSGRVERSHFALEYPHDENMHLVGGLEEHPTFGLVPSNKILLINGRKATVENAGTLQAARIQPFVAPYTAPDGAASLLVAGGIGSLGQALGTAERFNLETGSSTPLPPMHEKHVAGSATVADDGTVWVYGGATTTDFSPPTFKQFIHGRLEMFDPATQTWVIDPNWFGKGRAGHGSDKLLDGRLIFVGGIESGTGAISSEVWMFNPVTKFWSQAPDLPIPLYEMAVWVDPELGAVHVFGGATGSTGAIVPSGDLYTWHPGTPGWTSSGGGAPRVQPRVSATKNAAIVSGGAGANVVQTSTGISGDPVLTIEIVTPTGIYPIDDLFGASHSIDVVPLAFVEESPTVPGGGVDYDLIHVVLVDGSKTPEEVSIRVSDFP